MNTEDIETIIGFPIRDLDGITKFCVFGFLGDEIEDLDIAESIEESLEAIRVYAFKDGDGEPDEGDWPVDDPSLGPLAYVLSEAFLMDRKTDETKLYYLKDVIQDEPDLRLVVAWEAASPAHDVAFGIFAPRKT
jgi:hypothetical protein